MQTKPLARRTLALAIAVVVSGACTGCGSERAADDGAAAAGTTTPTATQTPAPTPTPAAVPFTPARAGYWELSYAGDPDADASSLDGASISLQVQVAKPVRAQPAALPARFASLLGVCSADPETDLAIPAIVRLSNTSEQPLTVELGAEWTDAADPNIQAALRYSDGGTTCADFMTSVRWTDTKPHGASIQHVLFLIRGYYSAEYPKGRPKAVGLQMVRFKPQLITSTDEPLSMDIDCYGGESYSWDDFGASTPDPSQHIAVALHYPPGITDTATGDTRSCD